MDHELISPGCLTIAITGHRPKDLVTGTGAPIDLDGAIEALLARACAHEEQIVITTGIATKSFTLAAPSSGQKTLWVVIKPDGSIEETPEAEDRASPCCGK